MLKYTDVSRPVRVELRDGTTLTGRLYDLQFTMRYIDDSTFGDPHRVERPSLLEYSFDLGDAVDLTVVQGGGTVVTFLDTEERIEL